MTLMQEAGTAPIHLEESERFAYTTHGTLPPDASLTTGTIWFVSSHGGLTRPPIGGSWLDDSAADVRRWLEEPANWDGYGARRVAPIAAFRALELLRRLAPLNVPRPFITGTTDGGLNLQWESDRYDLQIVVRSDEADAFYWDKQENVQWEGPLDRGTLLKGALSAMALE